VIDSQGYRANVCIILCNPQGKVFWGRRIGMDSWQFPQGGIKPDESPREAMLRELEEETGLLPQHVEVLGWTRDWLRYRLPRRYIRRRSRPICIGQKQIWYLLRFLGSDEDFRLDHCGSPEFDGWQWVDYWTPLEQVVFFKREVYRLALTELEPLLESSFRAAALPSSS